MPAGDEGREAMFAELHAYMDAQIDDHVARPRDDLTSMARLVAQDFDFHGHPLKEGDWLLLPFPAANRDPDFFEDPDVVRLDRAQNRHAAFGLGRHRCLGSHLARMELRVAIEEWLARYPAFELADPAAVTWSGGQVRGPRALPVKVEPVRIG
jgi:cytochrome P450